MCMRISVCQNAETYVRVCTSITDPFSRSSLFDFSKYYCTIPSSIVPHSGIQSCLPIIIIAGVCKVVKRTTYYIFCYNTEEDCRMAYGKELTLYKLKNFNYKSALPSRTNVSYAQAIQVLRHSIGVARQ